MNDIINRCAQAEDKPAVRTFYMEVCRHQVYDEYGPSWHWGKYPTQDGLAEAVDQQQFLLSLKDDRIMAACQLTVGNDPIYLPFAWPTPIKDDKEIAIIHLYAVHPDFRGQGLSAVLLNYAKEAAKQLGCKVIRMDCKSGNLPARKLYERNGFNYFATAKVRYKDTGPTSCDLLEYVLK